MLLPGSDLSCASLYDMQFAYYKRSTQVRGEEMHFLALDLVLERNVRNMPDIHGRILGRVVMEAGFSGDRTQNTANSWYKDTQ
jgi:hypothetical protein